MGVGDGGFSGITPCLRRMSFLSRSVYVSPAYVTYIPFSIHVGVINRYIYRPIHDVGENQTNSGYWSSPAVVVPGEDMMFYYW